MEKEKKHPSMLALLQLLDEPDEIVFQKVRGEILQYEMEILPSLKLTNENSFVPLVNERIESLIDEIYEADLYHRFVEWSRSEEATIENGLFLTSRLFTRDLLFDYFVNHFASLYTDIWREINEDLTDLELIKVINHILFRVYNYSIVPPKNISVKHYYVSEILKTKDASEMSIAALYLWITEKLGLLVKAVLLPNKIILAFYSPKGNVLFYINPSDFGSVFTKREIEKYLEINKIEKKESFFEGVSTISFFTYYLSVLELHQEDNLISEIKEIIHNTNTLYEKNN